MMKADSRSAALFCAALLLASGCGGPTTPSCSDKYGRGSSQPDYVILSCAASGSDLQCNATATNEYRLDRALPVSLDVTGSATWVSSDPNVASFGQAGTPAGFLKVAAPGLTEISARYGYLQPDSIAFTVAPGSPPADGESVRVGQDATTADRLSGVQVRAMPAQDATQSCLTNAYGSCSKLWVLPGAVQIDATKDGYQPGSVEPDGGRG